MNFRNERHLLKICAALSVFLLMGCNFLKNKSAFIDGSSSGAASPGGITGSGSGLSGIGDLSVPTGKAAFARISNGLEGNVSLYQGSLQNAYPQLVANFTNSTDPTAFSGAGANMLISYSACADVSDSHLSLYNINTSATVAANKTALVNAGLRILDRHTANLASGSSVTAQVSAALGAIVDQSVANGVSPKMAFVTMCTATSSAASTMLGF
jgi:hypothetical protein